MHWKLLWGGHWQCLRGAEPVGEVTLGAATGGVSAMLISGNQRRTLALPVHATVQQAKGLVVDAVLGGAR